jgi:hypothetical protein
MKPMFDADIFYGCVAKVWSEVEQLPGFRKLSGKEVCVKMNHSSLPPGNEGVARMEAGEH